MKSEVGVVFRDRLRAVSAAADHLLLHGLHVAETTHDLDLAAFHFFHRVLHVGANHRDRHPEGAEGDAASNGPVRVSCPATGWTVHCDDSVTKVHVGR